MKRKLFRALTAPLLELCRRNKEACLDLYERLSPVHRVNSSEGVWQFFCPNELTAWRVRTFFTKEPDTIRWMRSFNKEDIFYDVGANIGLYTLYAAKQGNRVFSFEPESQNYALLNKNIFLNAMQDSISAFNIALSNKVNFDFLYLREFTFGGALNNFAQNINLNYERFNPAFKQACVSFNLDELVLNQGLPFPTHIKIDVDGIEPRIIEGAKEVLQNRKLKSLLIELNTGLDDHMSVISVLKEFGFSVSNKVRSALDDPSCKLYNYIFERN